MTMTSVIQFKIDNAELKAMLKCRSGHTWSKSHVGGIEFDIRFFITIVLISSYLLSHLGNRN